MTFEETIQTKPEPSEPSSSNAKTVTKTGTISLPARVLKQPKGKKAAGKSDPTASTPEQEPKQTVQTTSSEAPTANATTGGEEENPWFTVSTSGTGEFDRSSKNVH